MADVKYYQDRVCACGCGEKIMVSRWHEYGRGIPRFIHGHNSKIENPNPKKFSHQQEEEIIQKYNEGLTGNVLAEEYGTTPTTIWRIFKRRGIPMRNLSDAHRKYSFNEKVFNRLTPQVAYWLGFIYADGTVDEKRGILRILLHEKDGVILEEFRHFLESNHRIYGFTYGKKRIVQIQVVSKYLIGRLKELDVHQNKTHSIRFPDFLPETLQSDFIRGYFDGDGSISINGRGSGQIRFSITSQPKFLEKVQKILMDNCGLKKTKFYQYKGKTSVNLSYGGNKQVQRILVYLTKNKGFYLPRKIGRWLPFRI